MLVKVSCTCVICFCFIEGLKVELEPETSRLCLPASFKILYTNNLGADLFQLKFKHETRFFVS